MQIFRADDYRGKRQRLSAWMSTEKADSAQLWLRLDSAKSTVGFDNMDNRAVTGTTGWKKYELTLDVPAATVKIAFGVIVSGQGQVWVDDFGSFQAVEMPFPSKSGLRTFTVDPAPEGSLDAMLAVAGLRIAAIDLRGLPQQGPVAKWFGEPRATRSIGAGYGEQFAANFLDKQVAPKNYDALLFVEKTTAARPLPRAAPQRE